MLRRLSRVAALMVAGLSTNCQKTQSTQGEGVQSPILVDSPAASTNPAGSEDGSHAVVACGKSTCRVGPEKCCPLGEGSCVPIGEFAQYCKVGDTTTGAVLCDDATDCVPGQVCCWKAADSENEYAECGSKPCQLHEACVNDGSCRAGWHCQPPHNALVPGMCERDRIEVQCGNTKCTGATPVCCWNPFGPGGERCIGAREACSPHADPPGVAIECRGAKDCDGEQCCGSFGTTCMGSCTNSSIICETERDCPADYAGIPLRGCLAGQNQQDPPWLKSCVYER